MLKSELLEMLKDIEDNVDINETIQSIKGLIKPLDFNTMGLEDFKNVLQNNKEIQAYNQSQIDSGIGKGIASFKEKTLPGIIKEELKKANNKDKTPEQLAYEELSKKFEKLEKEKLMAENTNKYSKLLAENGLDSRLVDFVISEDEEKGKEKINTIKSIVEEYASKKIKEKLDINNFDPSSPTIGGGKISWDDVQQDPSLYEKWINQK